MRPIKFRAWDPNAERMVYSDQQYDNYFFEFEDGKLFCFCIIQDGCEGDLYEPPSPSCERINNLMQYTGLKDRHGKDIYEGDILRRLDPLKSKEEYTKNPYKINIVKWSNFNAGFDICRNTEDEIIGNIYDNAELLERGGEI